MSFNTPALPVSKVLDPRLKINNQRHAVALKGALVNSWQQFAATNKNNSNVQITCNPPNRGIVVSRLVYKRFKFTVTVSGTNTSGAPLLSVGYFAPRANPILAVTSSEQMTINNDTLTQAPVSQYWNALQWYHNKHDNRFGQGSLTPSMLDQYQSYSDEPSSIRNPLGIYGDNSFENTRGGYSGMVVGENPNGGTSVEISLTVTEPIHLSPFVADAGSNFTSGFVGIQNMAYTATLGDLSRVMSIVKNQGAPGLINITNVAVTLDDASLLFEYLTPDPVEPIPRSLSTNYFSIVSYPTKSTVPIAPGGAVSITMQSVQVTSIPRRAYVYARLDDSLQTAFTSDSYFALNSAVNPLTVTWNNNQFFSQATSQDLYNMSSKNGVQQSWSQWDKFTGSVMSFDFGTDLGLMSDQAGGSLGNYQLGLTCQFVNRNLTDSIAPTLYVVLVYEGAFDIIDGACSHNIGILSHNDIMNAKEDPMITYKKVEQVYGGDFFSSLKNFFTKTLPVVGNRVLDAAATYAPGPYGIAAKIGRKILTGRGKRRKGGVLSGDMYGGRRMGARRLRGGALNSGEGHEEELTEEEYTEIRNEVEKLGLSEEESIKLYNETVKEIQNME